MKVDRKNTIRWLYLLTKRSCQDKQKIYRGSGKGNLSGLGTCRIWTKDKYVQVEFLRMASSKRLFEGLSLRVSFSEQEWTGTSNHLTASGGTL